LGPFECCRMVFFLTNILFIPTNSHAMGYTVLLFFH
jgi:hypothetical protein